MQATYIFIHKFYDLRRVWKKYTVVFNSLDI